jgi:hypothetical protein
MGLVFGLGLAPEEANILPNWEQHYKKKALIGISILTFITNVRLIFSIVAYCWKMLVNKIIIHGVLQCARNFQLSWHFILFARKIEKKNLVFKYVLRILQFIGI